MFDIQTTLLGLTAAINAGLFAFVYRGNPRSPIHRSFALFVSCLCVWALLHVGFRLVASDVLASVFLKSSYVCALLIAASFYYFSIIFPEGRRPRALHFAGLVSIASLFSLALLTPGFLTGAVLHEPYGRAVVLHRGDYIAFLALFCALFLGGQIRLWLKYWQAKGAARAQLLAIAMSVTVIGVVCIFFDLILPSPFFEDFQFVWTGPVLTSVFAVVTTYAIFRYRLFNLKAAIVELVIFAWWLFIFARAVSSNPSLNSISDQALLALSIPIGTLLLRALHLDRRRHERGEE